MAEIKSTLDIIMEKTRGLTMTEEEKAVMRDKELAGKIRGLLKKYQDGAISLGKFKEEWYRPEKGEEKALAILTRMCVKNIEPEGENRSLIALLDEVAGVETGPIRDALDRAEAELETRRSESLERIRRAFSERGISGSAIRPNLNADPQWKEIASQVRQKLHATLLSLALK